MLDLVRRSDDTTAPEALVLRVGYSTSGIDVDIYVPKASISADIYACPVFVPACAATALKSSPATIASASSTIWSHCCLKFSSASAIVSASVCLLSSTALNFSLRSAIFSSPASTSPCRMAALSFEPSDNCFTSPSSSPISIALARLSAYDVKYSICESNAFVTSSMERDAVLPTSSNIPI